MPRTNRTNLTRAARTLQARTDLTYTQALAVLRAAGTPLPDLDDAAAVAALVAARPAAGPGAPDSAATGEASAPAHGACRWCGFPLEPDPASLTGWTHTEQGGRSGGLWCNPDHTPANAHTLAQPSDHDDTATGDRYEPADEDDDSDEDDEGDEDDPFGLWCHFCGQRAGADYHLAGVIPAEENRVVCDDCWDERLR